VWTWWIFKHRGAADGRITAGWCISSLLNGTCYLLLTLLPLNPRNKCVVSFTVRVEAVGWTAAASWSVCVGDKDTGRFRQSWVAVVSGGLNVLDVASGTFSPYWASLGKRGDFASVVSPPSNDSSFSPSSLLQCPLRSWSGLGTRSQPRVAP